jgi:hypothetical protein
MSENQNKEKVLKEASAKKEIYLIYRGTRIKITVISCQKPCKREESEVKYLVLKANPTNLEFSVLGNYASKVKEK